MEIVLNKAQTKQFSDFLANMSAAWFVGGYISPKSMVSLVVFTFYGIISLYLSLMFLRRIR
jgi:hypothetical protein